MKEFIELEPDMEEIVKRLEKLVISPENEVYGLRRDVANFLGMTASNLSKSIERNSIPYSRLYSFARINNLSLDWILDGVNIEQILNKHLSEKFEILVTQSKGKVFHLLSMDLEQRQKEFKVIIEELDRKNYLMNKLTYANSSIVMSLVDIFLGKLKNIGNKIEITSYPDDMKNYEPYWLYKIYECRINNELYEIIHCENFNVATNFLGSFTSKYKNNEKIEKFEDKFYDLFYGSSEEIIMLISKR